MTQQKLDDLIELIAESIERRLFYANMTNNLGITSKESVINYNGYEFPVKELQAYDIQKYTELHRFIIEVPRYIYSGRYIQAFYQKAHTRELDMRLRRDACYKLATTFVTEIVPKVDFEVKKAVYARNIDQILSVLD